MILESALNKFMRDLINSILDYPDFAIEAKDNGPRPLGPYASVDVMIIKSIGHDHKKLANESASQVRETIEGYREVNFSIGFYRDGNTTTSVGQEFSALDNARFVNTGLMRPSSLAAFRASNMGLVLSSDVRDISELLDGSVWEKRGHFDLTLSAMGSDAQVVDAIDAITISGVFETRGTIIPISVEVNT
jgi:hypothetical protein